MQAVGSFVGQNYGAFKWRRLHKGFRVQILSMILYGSCVSALMLLFGRYIFMLFIPGNETVIKYGAAYLTIMAFCQPPACVEGVAGGNFRGMGQTLPPSITSLSFNSLRVLLAYVFMKSGLALFGVWLGVCTASSLRGLALLIWFLIARRKLPTEDYVKSSLYP
jgi:Na+-driven multidrug efflux pump